MVVTLRQQYNTGEKPTVMLYNRHGRTPNKTKTKDTMSLDYSSICYIGSRIGWVSMKELFPQPHYPFTSTAVRKQSPSPTSIFRTATPLCKRTRRAKPNKVVGSRSQRCVYIGGCVYYLIGVLRYIRAQTGTVTVNVTVVSILGDNTSTATSKILKQGDAQKV